MVLKPLSRRGEAVLEDSYIMPSALKILLTPYPQTLSLNGLPYTLRAYSLTLNPE